MTGPEPIKIEGLREFRRNLRNLDSNLPKGLRLRGTLQRRSSSTLQSHAYLSVPVRVDTRHRQSRSRRPLPLLVSLRVVSATRTSRGSTSVDGWDRRRSRSDRSSRRVPTSGPRMTTSATRSNKHYSLGNPTDIARSAGMEVTVMAGPTIRLTFAGGLV